MTPHTHREVVPGCYRCELGRDEVMGNRPSDDEILHLRAVADAADDLRNRDAGDSLAECLQDLYEELDALTAARGPHEAKGDG